MSYKGHGGSEIVESIARGNAENRMGGLTRVAISRQTAHEVISIAYGFFTPLTGFMGQGDLSSVLDSMELENGILWSIPIVYTVSENFLKSSGIREDDSILLTYMDAPLAVLHVNEIFAFDKKTMAEKTFGTSNPKHPGVRRTLSYGDTFIGGKIELVNEPIFNYPFSEFWFTPREHFDIFRKKGWKHIVAHQTRNVPHGGHEALMKQAWFAANEDLPVDSIHTGVLVNAIMGEKRIGDYIDEAILLGQQALNDGGYFRSDVHMVSFTLWDMRYAGPREAIFHSILRANLGCTHHMFGRDHAGVGNFYGPYDAQNMLSRYRERLSVKPVFLMENWYCPVSGEVTSASVCGHSDVAQKFSGTLIRSILNDGVKPTKKIMRPEVFDSVMLSAEKYGHGSPFVTEEYLRNRQSIFTLKKQEDDSDGR